MMPHPSRRLVLVAAAAGMVSVRPIRAAPSKDEPIAQPKQRGHSVFIERAFALRQAAIDAGDQPYGALVVRDGLIIGEAPSRVIVKGDPTAHAEMEAIRDAAGRAGADALAGSILYSSSRPCAMCSAAAYWAGIAELISGQAALSGGPPLLTHC